MKTNLRSLLCMSALALLFSVGGINVAKADQPPISAQRTVAALARIQLATADADPETEFLVCGPNSCCQFPHRPGCQDGN